MSTITSLNGSDTLTASRSVINTNFTNLNSTKKEDSMTTNKLLGRNTSGTGVIEEITLGTNLSMTGTTLNSSGGGGITIGTTAITSGTSGRILYDNAGIVGELPVGTGIATFIATPSSANLIASVTDETGTGSLVFGTTPTIATPIINGLATGTGVSSASAASTLMARDSSGNSFANNTVEGFTTTATAAGTTTMTVTSTYYQVWTGSTTQTVKLGTTSVLAGHQHIISNQSTGSVTVQSSGANTIQILGAGMNAIFTALVVTPTTAANWSCALEDSTGANLATTATANAATINLAYKTNTITNNSAATLTITIPTAGAIDGEMRIVRVLDFSAVAQTLTLVNTENSTVTPAATTNGSTTLPYTFGVQFNNVTTKWRVIASA